MHLRRYCTARFSAPRAVLAVLLTAAALATAPTRAAQDPPAMPAPGDAAFRVFLQGREVGGEQISVARTASGWTIVSTGRMVAPVNLTNRRFELTYAPDGQPIELKIDALVQEQTGDTVRDQSLALATSFGTTTAINEITQNGVTTSKTDQISARSVVLPNNFFAAYEGLAARLAGVAAGADLPIYIAPQAEIRMHVRSITPTSYQMPSGTIETRQYSVTFQNPGGPLAAEITIDARNRFAKLEMPAAGLSVVRLDLAGVATRQQTFKNPTDSDVRIPASGFSLAGTLTTPAVQGRLRHPAIVLVAGAGPTERDATMAGIPVFGQLAGQLADQGFVVLRYDKRGVGQSGGRTETVTLQDYADDALAAVKWIRDRRDVDNRRVFAVGHSEGSAIALLAARDKKINGLVLMAGMGTTGRELILEQQQRALTAARVPDQERMDKIELQKKILEAAVAETGWESLPPDVRPLVDTPWYRSLLTFDPAKALARAKQPILVLQGALDLQTPPHHAERLGDMARARKKSGSVEVKILPALDHLFVAAGTGAASENPAVPSKTISPEVAKAISAWVASVPR